MNHERMEGVIQQLTRQPFRCAPIGEVLVEGLSALLHVPHVNCYLREVNGTYEVYGQTGDQVPDALPETHPLIQALATQRVPLSRTAAPPDLQSAMQAVSSDLSVPWLCQGSLFAVLNLGRGNTGEPLRIEELTPSQHLLDLARQRLEFAWLQERRVMYSRRTAHDLHQPLKASVPAALYTLRKKLVGPLTSEQEKLLADLARDVDTLNQGFDRLFLFERFYEALHKGELEWASVDLRAICQAVVEPFRPRFEQNGVAFQVTLPATSCEVRGDPEALRLALYHVLHNAWRYTAHGEVRLAVQAEPARYTIVVSDTGPGIPRELQETLWQPFLQMRPCAQHPDGHLPGVGLSFVLTTMQEHHGQVHLESRPGQGTTCTLTFPLGKK
ncbi:MAG: HAMP domain-containing histidine kinase [Elusimicrobia bacterium]|nr:HAMP domain-containing histidine kinase [Elusimicrobiota bacterium]